MSVAFWSLPLRRLWPRSDQIIEDGMKKNENGSWEAPLLFRQDVKDLPSSRANAMKRPKSTRRTLDKNPVMKKQYFTFMKKISIPIMLKSFRRKIWDQRNFWWYLPHFGLYHPKKKDKIHVVFDTAAEFNGVSLNKLLLSGPDLTNNLLGVLLRFCQDPVALVADIEQMFGLSRRNTETFYGFCDTRIKTQTAW